MTLKDYILGRRINLHSNLPRLEIKEKIDNAAGSAFSPFAHGVTGGVYLGQIRLGWSTPIFNNGFRPIFVGRLSESLGRTQVSGRFGAPVFVLAFFSIWYVFLSLFTCSFIYALITDAPREGDVWTFWVVIPVFWLLFPVLHFIFNRRAEHHLNEILELLEKEAGLSEHV
ncbi:hypothetical protein [Altererythrobacter lutimaris]|uniref:Uncharacterized protein n=1 Tax=Altererythrobacter lutimaris TaxID=2743979 RepID=A0A850HE16_9SPHN|nr:hypothetical protein [Altererythrobacter lutimaris]NVE95695.1 hypothetical protein [Altererythrobacter lutimaris]